MLDNLHLQHEQLTHINPQSGISSHLSLAVFLAIRCMRISQCKQVSDSLALRCWSICRYPDYIEQRDPHGSFPNRHQWDCCDDSFLCVVQKRRNHILLTP